MGVSSDCLHSLSHSSLPATSQAGRCAFVLGMCYAQGILSCLSVRVQGAGLNLFSEASLPVVDSLLRVTPPGRHSTQHGRVAKKKKRPFGGRGGKETEQYRQTVRGRDGSQYLSSAGTFSEDPHAIPSPFEWEILIAVFRLLSLPLSFCPGFHSAAVGSFFLFSPPLFPRRGSQSAPLLSCPIAPSGAGHFVLSLFCLSHLPTGRCIS